MSSKSKITASRFNQHKPKWSLIYYMALLPLVKALEFGAKKYTPNNWKKGMKRSEILDSIQRHLAALVDGEELDRESRVEHVGHIMANCMFYEYHYYHESFTPEYKHETKAE